MKKRQQESAVMNHNSPSPLIVLSFSVQGRNFGAIFSNELYEENCRLIVGSSITKRKRKINKIRTLECELLLMFGFCSFAAFLCSLLCPKCLHFFQFLCLFRFDSFLMSLNPAFTHLLHPEAAMNLLRFVGNDECFRIDVLNQFI